MMTIRLAAIDSRLARHHFAYRFRACFDSGADAVMTSDLLLGVCGVDTPE